MLRVHSRARAQVELLTLVHGRQLTAIVWLPLTSDVQPSTVLQIDGQPWIVRRILEGPYRVSPREPPSDALPLTLAVA